MITGGSIIMPMLIRIEATAMSMIRKGTKIRKPISKARFSSDSMKAEAKVVTATWAGSLVGFCLAMYESGKTAAPICVAKGVDALALRIRAVAEENDVPVVENPPLARALHAAIELDEPVPAEHFKAVAQVIGYVMRLQGKLPARAS